MSILSIHPTGNKNFFYLIKALKKKILLKAIFLSLNINSNNKVYSFLPKKIRFYLKRRDFTKFKTDTYSLMPIFELSRLLNSKLKMNNIFAEKILNDFFSENKLYVRFDKEASNKIKKIHTINKVYAYEGSALETFRVAKKMGIQCIYEMPINYWREKKNIINKEYHKNKRYRKFLNYDDLKSFNKRIDEELSLADQIIVPSTKIKKSLSLYPRKLSNINVINYPYDPTIKSTKKIWFNGKLKLKVLFVGRLDSRKGMVQITEALKYLKKKKQLNNFEIIFVGSGKFYNKVKSEFNEITIYPSLPNNLVMDMMKKSDVLLFPSLFEGYGLSAVEAMSRGMTVICSKNCGFLDSCSNKDVMILKSNTSLNISKSLMLLFKSPKLVKKIGLNAINAASKYQFDEYEKKLINIIGK